MFCSKCGYKSPKGMSELAACYHHDIIMGDKCPLINKSKGEKIMLMQCPECKKVFRKGDTVVLNGLIACCNVCSKEKKSGNTYVPLQLFEGGI